MMGTDRVGRIWEMGESREHRPIFQNITVSDTISYHYKVLKVYPLLQKVGAIGASVAQ